MLLLRGMKAMKSLSLALYALLFIFCVGAEGLAQQPSCDRACVQSVRGLLQESYHGFSSGWGEKANNRLGDKVGVAILHIFKRKALYKPDNIRTFLPVIQQAFKYPDMIESTEDRNPRVTTALLRRLKRKIKDHFLNLEITRALNLVQFSSQRAALPEDRTQHNKALQLTAR
jgi:hypothetical protein